MKYHRHLIRFISMQCIDRTLLLHPSDRLTRHYGRRVQSTDQRNGPDPVRWNCSRTSRLRDGCSLLRMPAGSNKCHSTACLILMRKRPTFSEGSVVERLVSGARIMVGCHGNGTRRRRPNPGPAAAPVDNRSFPEIRLDLGGQPATRGQSRV
jgi:hypothetical protein